MRKLFFGIVTAIVFSAAAATAQAPSDFQKADSGYFAVFYPRITFRGDNQPETGDGVGVKFGGSKENVFGAFLSAFKTRHDNGPGQTALFTGLTGDLKLSIPLFRIVSPYGSAGIGRYVLEKKDTVYRGNQDGSGINGYQVGAGLDFHLSELFTLNLGYTKRRMAFDSGTPGGSEIRQQVKEFDVGLAVHFH